MEEWREKNVLQLFSSPVAGERATWVSWINSFFLLIFLLFRELCRGSSGSDEMHFKHFSSLLRRINCRDAELLLLALFRKKWKRELNWASPQSTRGNSVGKWSEKTSRHSMRKLKIIGKMLSVVCALLILVYHLSREEDERGSSHAERTNNTKLLCRCRARELDSKQITEQRISFIIIYSHSQIAMQFNWREFVLAVK